ncbi:MAG: hypothetical protein ABRQ39_32760, partial [Candidatus Eremiobacterota bacterium]
MLNPINYALSKVIDFTISFSPASIEKYIHALRTRYPGISNDELAYMLVNRKSVKNGFIGAVSGLGSIITLPITVPANLIATWRIQAFMAYSIAYIYGHTFNTDDLKTDLYLIMAGDSAKEALKNIGITAGKEVTKKAVQKYITRDLMKKIWEVIGQKIISKAGEKSLISFMKM